jgi:hypothetical protein
MVAGLYWEGHKATQRFRDEPHHVHTKPEDDILQDCPCYNKEDKMSRKDEVLRRMRVLEAELARLEERPQEPESTDGQPLVIFFKKQFGGPTSSRPFIKPNTKYHYAFIKAGGLWNGTGPKAPKAFTWDELMDWLENSGPFPKKIYVLNRPAEPYWTKRED